MKKVKVRTTNRRNPRYRRRNRTIQERIVYQVANHINENFYEVKTLAELRKRMKLLAGNDKFWDSLKAIEVATKNLGSLRLIE